MGVVRQVLLGKPCMNDAAFRPLVPRRTCVQNAAFALVYLPWIIGTIQSHNPAEVAGLSHR